MQDGVDEFFENAMQDPAFAAAYEDAQQRSGLLTTLVDLRKHLGLNQQHVADRMGVKQSTVSEFESGANDPHFSTLQRYARAVHSHLAVRAVVDHSDIYVANTSDALVRDAYADTKDTTAGWHTVEAVARPRLAAAVGGRSQ